MFGTLRAGSHLYILSKSDTPSLTIGQVQSVTPPRPKLPTTFVPSLPMEQVVDLTVKVGDDIKTFTGVSTALSIVDTGAGGYVISDDRSAITAEVEAFGTMSQNALNAVPYHQRVVEACKQMMLDLNPSLQKEAERDQELTTLRSEISEMRTAMSEMTSLLRGVLTPNPKNRKE